MAALTLPGPLPPASLMNSWLSQANCSHHCIPQCLTLIPVSVPLPGLGAFPHPTCLIPGYLLPGTLLLFYIFNIQSLWPRH